MKKKVKIVNVEEIESIRPLGHSCVKRLITKKREGSDKLMLGISINEPGEEFTWIYEDIDAAYYVLSGEMTLSWDKKKAKIETGNAFYLPQGKRYTLRNTGAKPAKIIYVFNPPLE